MIRKIKKKKKKVAEPFITGIKLNISTAFITQYYFAVQTRDSTKRI